jgi:serine/threonine protein kinase
MLTQRDGGGLVKIVDLGVAAHLQRVFDNVMVGTPHYMAPGGQRRAEGLQQAPRQAEDLAWRACLHQAWHDGGGSLARHL